MYTKLVVRYLAERCVPYRPPYTYGRWNVPCPEFPNVPLNIRVSLTQVDIRKITELPLSANTYLIYWISFKLSRFKLVRYSKAVTLTEIRSSWSRKIEEDLLTCKMASVIVVVFPVPGGPNTMYGSGRLKPRTMFCTAVNCSQLLAMLLLREWNKTLNLLYAYDTQY